MSYSANQDSSRLMSSVGQAPMSLCLKGQGYRGSFKGSPKVWMTPLPGTVCKRNLFNATPRLKSMRGDELVPEYFGPDRYKKFNAVELWIRTSRRSSERPAQ